MKELFLDGLRINLNEYIA